MKIGYGLQAGQVLQRNRQGRGMATLTGNTRKNGDVAVRILKNEKVLRGHDWKIVGSAKGRQFKATITEIPTGGPYRVELRIDVPNGATESLIVDELFVGDVWILAGQSNMQGCGNRVDAPKPHPRVRAFTMRDEWDMAEEPMHLLAEAVDSVHNGYGTGPSRPSRAELARLHKHALNGVSPSLYFALDMVKRTRVPQGLIACAHGGTSMAQWSPALRDQGSASLYGAMMRRFEKLGQPVAGVLWYQGESDAGAEPATVYTEKMVELVAATRRDMNQPTLPWLIVQIGCHFAPSEGHWNNIQEQQRRLPECIQHLDVAPAIDLEVDDGIHISGKDQAILGRRLARLADRLVHKNRKAKPSIRLERVTANLGSPFPGEPVTPFIEVTYTHVAGALQSAGRPHGFALLASDGTKMDGLHKTRLRGRTVILYTSVPRAIVATSRLNYGHGRYPYCNITDAEGMSLPAMAGVPIGGAVAPFATAWETTSLGSTLAKTRYQQAAQAKGWHKAPLEQSFLMLPAPLSETRDGVYAFRTQITAPEALDAILLFGADSPFVVWLNGKRVIKDAKACNPALPDEYRAAIKLKRGANELLVAFDSRAGDGWGICARLEDPNGKKLDEQAQY